MSMDTSIKVMYLNPVGTSIYDETFAKMVSTYKYPATAVDVVSLNPATVPPKMTNLEYRAYEALIVADTVKAVRQASRENYDAVVIGCFYDPALADAREISGETKSGQLQPVLEVNIGLPSQSRHLCVMVLCLRPTVR